MEALGRVRLPTGQNRCSSFSVQTLAPARHLRSELLPTRRREDSTRWLWTWTVLSKSSPREYRLLSSPPHMKDNPLTMLLVLWSGCRALKVEHWMVLILLFSVVVIVSLPFVALANPYD